MTNTSISKKKYTPKQDVHTCTSSGNILSTERIAETSNQFAVGHFILWTNSVYHVFSQTWIFNICDGNKNDIILREIIPSWPSYRIILFTFHPFSHRSDKTAKF